MNIVLNIEPNDYNTRRIEALIVSRADLERIETKLPESCELSRDEEFSEAIEKDMYLLTGHGNEPLGEVQTALREALPKWDERLPKDTGYDTDADGEGYNGIYLYVDPHETYTAYYRSKRQYLTDDGKQFYGHYAIKGDSPQAVLAEVQEDANDFDIGGIWKGDTLLYLIARECDEEKNVMTNVLTLGETGTIADDEAHAIRERYEELSAKELMPEPVHSSWALKRAYTIDELFEDSKGPEEEGGAK